MFNKIINIFAQFFFIILLLILLVSSLKVVYLNLKHFRETKTGTIIDIDYSRASQSDGSNRGTFHNTILTDIEVDTIYGGSKNQYFIGDKVRVNYRGIGGNTIFEVNGIKVGSKYDAWSLWSPILLLFCFFMLYKAFSFYRKKI